MPSSFFVSFFSSLLHNCFCFTPSSRQRQLSLWQKCISSSLFTPKQATTTPSCVCCVSPPSCPHWFVRKKFTFRQSFQLISPLLFPSRSFWIYKWLQTGIKSQKWLLLSGQHQVGDEQNGKCVNMTPLNIFVWRWEIKPIRRGTQLLQDILLIFHFSCEADGLFLGRISFTFASEQFPAEDDPDIESK